MSVTGEGRSSDGGGRERAEERAHFLHETGQHEVVRLPDLPAETDATAPERSGINRLLAAVQSAYLRIRNGRPDAGNS